MSYNYNKIQKGIDIILEDFLSSEAANDELSIAIINFINGPHIRMGEFECNQYVVKN